MDGLLTHLAKSSTLILVTIITGYNGGSIQKPDPPVKFGLLGPLLVSDAHGVPIPIPQAKQRVIMAALLLRANTTVSSTQLVDALWEEKPPPSATATIRTYIARLRQTISQMGTRLVTRPAGYVIEVSDAESDLGRLEQFRSDLLEAAQGSQWERVASVSEKALNLWRGTPLEDIPSPSLCQAVAAGLEEFQLQLIMTRIDAELCLGRERLVVAELRRLADEHPLREHVQSQLMLAYYRCGQQADALETYRKARASLIDELGTEPGSELHRMHQRILASDPILRSDFALSVIG